MKGGFSDEPQPLAVAVVMHDLARIIEQYIGETRKLSFRLRDGRECFGWLLMQYDETGENVDYEADSVSYAPAPSPFDRTFELFREEKVILADIDPDSLYYYDFDANPQWVKFTADF